MTDSIAPKRGMPSIRKDMFGGTGTVHVWDLLQKLAAPPFTAVISCELAAGGRVGRHVQATDCEIVIGLSGCGEARVEDRPIAFGPGAVVFLPLGSRLELVNERDDAPLCYLIVKATPPAS